MTPETHAVAAEVPLEYPYQLPALDSRIGTSDAGAINSGFLSGSWRGKIGFGHNLPLLSPLELPDHTSPFLLTPPTQITSDTDPGEATSPSSLVPSLPAAATTKTP